MEMNGTSISFSFCSLYIKPYNVYQAWLMTSANIITENLPAGFLVAPRVFRLLWTTNYLSVTWTHAIPIILSTRRMPDYLLWARAWWCTMRTAGGLCSEELGLRAGIGIYQQSEHEQFPSVSVCEFLFAFCVMPMCLRKLRTYTVFESVWWHRLFVFSWDSTGTINHSPPASLFSGLRGG